MSGGMGTAAAVSGVAARAEKAEEYDRAIDLAVEKAQTNANLFDTKEAMAKELQLDD
jgi:hypothetical protein